MKRLIVSIGAILFCTAAAWSAKPQLISDSRAHDVARSVDGYNGNWWASADHYERDGFVYGFMDCVQWSAGTKFPYREVDDLNGEIDRYYTAHPGSRSVSVVAVWKRVMASAPPAKPRPGGEKWTNPHGPFDGDFYRQGAQSERWGFLEGYIGCLRSYGTKTGEPETYSGRSSIMTTTSGITLPLTLKRMSKRLRIFYGGFGIRRDNVTLTHAACGAS